MLQRAHQDHGAQPFPRRDTAVPGKWHSIARGREGAFTRPRWWPWPPATAIPGRLAIAAPDVMRAAGAGAWRWPGLRRGRRSTSASGRAVRRAAVGGEGRSPISPSANSRVTVLFLPGYSGHKDGEQDPMRLSSTTIIAGAMRSAAGDLCCPGQQRWSAGFVAMIDSWAVRAQRSAAGVQKAAAKEGNKARSSGAWITAYVRIYRTLRCIRSMLRALPRGLGSYAIWWKY